MTPIVITPGDRRSVPDADEVAAVVAALEVLRGSDDAGSAAPAQAQARSRWRTSGRTYTDYDA